MQELLGIRSYLPQGRDAWRTVENTVINLSGFVKSTSMYICEKLDCSGERRAQFHGISNLNMHCGALHTNFTELNLVGSSFIVRTPKLIC
jgi:hypothetical protein